MPRRVSLPGASELFRATDQAGGQTPPDPPYQAGSAGGGATPEPLPSTTGRVRHTEKITVYVSGDELLALEQARLTLRARHGLAVDRGRIVREAIAGALADLEANGDDSELVRRLTRS